MDCTAIGPCDDNTIASTLTTEQANSICDVIELNERIKVRQLLYGTSIDGTPIRPNYSSATIASVARSMPDLLKVEVVVVLVAV